MTTSTSLACLHCDRPVDGPTQRHCPQCGQPTPPPRIDWHFLGHELEHSVLHMDRGLLFTLRELVLRPGRLFRDYLAGRRHGHAKPLLLIGISAAAVALAAHGLQMLHPQLGGSLTPISAADAPGTGIGRAMATAARWAEAHYALATLVLLPLEAACFRLLFGRRAGLNYPEWLVVVAFITVQTFLLQLVSIGVIAAWPAGKAVVTSMTSMLMWFVAFLSLRGLFRTWPLWSVALRCLLAFVVFSSLALALTTAAVVLIGRV